MPPVGSICHYVIMLQSCIMCGFHVQAPNLQFNFLLDASSLRQRASHQEYVAYVACKQFWHEHAEISHWLPFELQRSAARAGSLQCCGPLVGAHQAETLCDVPQHPGDPPAGRCAIAPHPGPDSRPHPELEVSLATEPSCLATGAQFQCYRHAARELGLRSSSLSDNP